MADKAGFTERIRRAALQYRREIAADGSDEGALPAEQIVVTETETGVTVTFFAAPADASVETVSTRKTTK